MERRREQYGSRKRLIFECGRSNKGAVEEL